QRFFDSDFFVSVLEHFNQSKMNNKKILMDIIDNERVYCLKIVENHGWIKDPRRRDELIEYASQNGRIESAAWLLDFKNRTADFAAEREKAEKKLMQELNRTPDSVTALKKIWGYKKREDGTLVITSYKGNEVEITVPERIGKNLVTAIGDNAFTGFELLHRKKSQIIQNRKITKITLPKTIQQIGSGAFSDMPLLKEINIPNGVKKIEDGVFTRCMSLQSITISGTIKTIGKCAFFECRNLESVHICEGVMEIGECAFARCSNLEKVKIPQSVQKMKTSSDVIYWFFNAGKEIFGECPKLVIYCPEGSVAEAYCKEKGISFRNSTD
ncbi:MAG: leucine-rich repeat domain-containing protein, partial [Lachnospiraceae bacterium]|nr:leucine-rich repeat domain-containing protein [Lachnospiraceae bacterium]